MITEAFSDMPPNHTPDPVIPASLRVDAPKPKEQRLTLYDFLRIGHIKRWHNVNTIRQQTVAEHTYVVTIIALDLFQQMVGVQDDPMSALNVVIGAIFHDAPEAAAGDTPTPAKRLLREITGDPALFDKLDDYLMPITPYIGKKVHPSLERFINMADKIESAFWISENGAGKHAEIVATANWRNLEDIVEKYDTEEPDAGWYTAVNNILMALGMRYVHKQSRISPP